MARARLLIDEGLKTKVVAGGDKHFDVAIIRDPPTKPYERGEDTFAQSVREAFRQLGIRLAYTKSPPEANETCVVTLLHLRDAQRICTAPEASSEAHVPVWRVTSAPHDYVW